MRYYLELYHFLPSSSTVFALFSLLFLVFFLFFKNSLSVRWGYFLIFIAVVCVGFSFSLIDPFIHPWDEQFHALVAKNMISNPFHPILLEKTICSDYKNWLSNSTWLHKQPLFLWQMAISIKCFGANFLAIRIPSILLHALTTVIIFSISKRILVEFLATIVVVLYGFSGLLNDYTSGVMGMDHNDIAFIFYVTLSLWSWVKFQETKNTKWLWLIGISSGGAILCKWLVGLLVYAGWGFIILVRDKYNKQEWIHLFKSFTITCVIALPWQIYCSIEFPQEFQYEMSYNALHLSKAVENHSGDFFFYFDKMKNVFGSGLLMRILLLIGFILSVFKGFKSKNAILLFCAFCFFLVYLFFSFSSTKLEGYVLIVAGFGFIFILVPFLDASPLFNRLKRPSILNNGFFQSCLILLILFLQFSPKGVVDRHNFKAPKNRDAWMSEFKIVEGIIRNNPDKNRFMIMNATIYNAPALTFQFDKEFYPYCEKDRSDALLIDFTKLK